MLNYYIRPIELKDARGCTLLRQQRSVASGTLAVPSARIEHSEEFIRNMGKNQHEFVAVIPLEDGSELVIGQAGLHVYQEARLSHSASLGIHIHEEYQDQGVGSALMETLLDIADNWLMLVRVELDVFIDNPRAIHLYEKLGFIKEGIRIKAAIKDGDYVDSMLMARVK